MPHIPAILATLPVAASCTFSCLCPAVQVGVPLTCPLDISLIPGRVRGSRPTPWLRSGCMLLTEGWGFWDKSITLSASLSSASAI